jgi:hypothetical protein
MDNDVNVVFKYQYSAEQDQFHADLDCQNSSTSMRASRESFRAILDIYAGLTVFTQDYWMWEQKCVFTV